MKNVGPLCLVPGGHKRVLTAITQFATFHGERTRFQSIMLDLARSRRENEFEGNRIGPCFLAKFNGIDSLLIVRIYVLYFLV